MPPKSKTTKVNPAAILAQQRVQALKEAEEKRLREEEELRKREEEEERERQEAEREKKLREEEERRKRQEKKDRKIAEGTYKTAADKKREQKLAATRNRGFATSIKKLMAMSDDEDEVDQDVEESPFRSPVLCVLGNVDVGKTKLLDYIRKTTIQDKEVAGITQQIGASFKPREMLPHPDKLKIPGMLFIDTPGHAAFSNLRKRGSAVCDLAIIVIEITGNIEPQTRESINICRENNIPFIIALNKIDRLYGWDPEDQRPVTEIIKDAQVRDEFETKFQNICRGFYEMEMNPVVYGNPQNDELVVCPVSAVTGQGVNDMLFFCAEYSQTYLASQITWSPNFRAFILESKRDSKDGSTIDVIVLDGELAVKDRVGLSTLSGGVVTEVRSLMMPAINAEMRMTSNYTSVRSVKGACGVKISAPNLEGALPGTPLVKLDDNDQEFEVLTSEIQLDPEGVTVYAPSIGQLEGLLSFLRESCSPPIKVGQVGVGKVFRKDIIGMSRYAEKKQPENLVILCFDVPVDPDAEDFIEENGIRVFFNRTIYRLYDDFNAWYSDFHTKRMAELRSQANFPCELSILPRMIFRKKDPIILGVRVEEGKLRKGVTLCGDDGTVIGKVTEIQLNNNPVEESVKNEEVSISIDCKQEFNRVLTPTSHLFTVVTRQSLDILKENFRSEITQDIAKLCMKTKRLLNIN